MSIQILPSDVIDQIAAGEVVERPAHLLKELIENSLDAGATRLEIDISEGGRRVKLSDNGFGMGPEDLQKAFERFATSKISTSEDLWQLKSFGFRGEALASISSVSRLSAVSRRKDSDQAYRIHNLFGQRSALEKLSADYGTSIHIQDLFENLPARKKFLKSDSAEMMQVRLVIKAMALSNPQMEIKFFEDGVLKNIYAAVPDQSPEFLEKRVKQVLGLNSVFSGVSAKDHFRIRFVLGTPDEVGKTNKNLWIFAQNRWVQDRSLQAAVLEAYRNLLMHGEYPQGVVWLECDPQEIDVNVHPTKSQVKFADPQSAFRAVYYSVRQVIETAPWNQKSNEPPPQTLSSMVPKNQDSPVHQTSFYRPEQDRIQYKQKSLDLQTLSTLAESRKEYSSSIVTESQKSEPPAVTSGLESSRSAEAVTVNPGVWSRLQVLGQAHQTYILTQSEIGLVLVDQHAAHERVAFERLMRDYKAGKPQTQDFLFPLSIDFEENHLEMIWLQKNELEKMGITIERMGPSVLGVSSAPVFLKEAALVEALKKLADEIQDHGQSFVFEKYLTDFFASLACHSVVRAGQALSIEQMQELLSQMDEFPLSGYCPHGRPVSVEFKWGFLEKEFGRKV